MAPNRNGRNGRTKRNGPPGGRREGTERPAAKTAAPVALREQVVADIIGIGHGGEGVGRVNGFTLFIHGVLPGERVSAEVTGLKKQYGFARLLDVLEESPDRLEPPCPVFDECGGCQLQHLGYDAQLRMKWKMVVDNLERIGKLRVIGGRNAEGTGNSGRLQDEMGEEQAGGRQDDEETERSERRQDGLRAEQGGEQRDAEGAVRFEKGQDEPGTEQSPGILVHPTIGMDDPWRYRNKVQVPIGEREGGLVGGFYATGSHTIVDSDLCLIRTEAADDIVSAVKRIAHELAIPAYEEEKRQSGLRHVIVKTAFRTGEIMVVLVTDQTKLPHVEQLTERIVAAVPGITSLFHNVNPLPGGGTVMGPHTLVLWGRDRIYDAIGDVRFAISAHSFYQVNPVQTEALYGKALEYAGLTGSETVIDAYCGVGTISLFLAQRAKQVYGVEIVPEAIEDARRNAELNGITNAEFEAGKAEEVIPAWRERGIRPDVIVVDPPRSGCDAALLDTIVAMRPERVVYVSCNPSTLARDLRVLEDGGFRTVEVQPVDMFPHTVHVESVCLLVSDGTEG
ncbi:23S rRNA (uracil(1939)-C(5))-methyltransferase RlmD [Paenibacillus hemerocallicola]|uniref:23S rRNA (Uracil(1939)-C(5))-methyltransferase RlmD n=1 Tax=Paenibacillus hemerocallicola TaxID=1172614 RepID=A0A5C4T635_9BACL|nr:23S rRNA (uracil(1939)-C(5))-methyltransferase RlmD [Paenibacillus hemerocallicola]TNJ64533.1 23S rRNA (uracil(1939)-C(5))-methyltransferase RlmD [Paenibacillus hemerocallicola]